MKFLSMLACTVGLLVGHQAQADERLAGAYEGIIFSGGEYPGMTVFEYDEEGRIRGKYVYRGHNGPDFGSLESCELKHLHLSCIWKDVFGSGDWIVRFSEDFSAFSGYWYGAVGDAGKSGSQGYRWDGSKDAVGSSFSETL